MLIKLSFEDLIKNPAGNFWSLVVVLNFMLATYFSLPNWILLPLICLSFWVFIKKKFSDKRIIFLASITLFSCFSFYICKYNSNEINAIDDLIPLSVLTFLLFNLAASTVINLKVIKLFVLFFIVEILTAMILFISGNKSIYHLISNLNNISNYDWSFQSSGVIALSDSTAALGVNAFLVLILIFQFFRTDKLFKLFTILGFLGVLLSGSKFMIFLLILFLGYNFFLIKKMSLFQSITLTLFSITLFLFILLGITSVHDLNQLMSERIRIAYKFYDFIKSNMLLGNNSVQYRYINASGKQFHAHNSFIQTIANHGLIYFLLIMGLIITQIRSSNVSSLFFLFLLSLCNHVLFWGFYHVDLIFAFILFQGSNKTEFRLNN